MRPVAPTRWFLTLGIVTMLIAAACSSAPESDPATEGASPIVSPTSGTWPATSASTEPDPADSDPDNSDPAASDSANSDPAASDPDNSDPAASDPANASNAAVVNNKLARTINLGAVLELERGEFPWGPELDSSDFVDIAETGFTAVRIPIKFSSWADTSAPYTIDDELWERTDAAINDALANDLAVIIDLHHYEEIFEDPAGHSDRFVGLWLQIAERYQSLPLDTVAFELLNEPNTNLDAPTWNALLAGTLAAVRTIDPDRAVLIGPVNWNSTLQVPNLELPDDNNIILTVHYYEPFEFTHQGAEWLPATDAYLGTRWDPTTNDAGALIDAEFADVAAWATERDLPVFLGEFGALDTADRNDRIAWTRWVREAADNEGFSWGVWDWASGSFGLQDDETNVWDTELLDALGLAG